MTNWYSVYIFCFSVLTHLATYWQWHCSQWLSHDDISKQKRMFVSSIVSFCYTIDFSCAILNVCQWVVWLSFMDDNVERSNWTDLPDFWIIHILATWRFMYNEFRFISSVIVETVLWLYVSKMFAGTVMFFYMMYLGNSYTFCCLFKTIQLVWKSVSAKMSILRLCYVIFVVERKRLLWATFDHILTLYLGLKRDFD